MDKRENPFVIVSNISKFGALRGSTARLNGARETGLTVMLAWISYFLPFFPINLQLSSSTLAATIWNRSWFFEKKPSSVRISCLRVFKHAIWATNWEFSGPNRAGNWDFHNFTAPKLFLFFALFTPYTLLQNGCHLYTSTLSLSVARERTDLLGTARGQSEPFGDQVCIELTGLLGVFFWTFFLSKGPHYVSVEAWFL